MLRWLTQRSNFYSPLAAAPACLNAVKPATVYGNKQSIWMIRKEALLNEASFRSNAGYR